MLDQAGFYLYERGRYTDAEPLYQRALAIWEKALDLEHPNVATSLYNLAALSYNQGQYVKAEPLALLLAFSRSSAGVIIAFMSPVHFTPEKECYSVLFL